MKRALPILLILLALFALPAHAEISVEPVFSMALDGVVGRDGGVPIEGGGFVFLNNRITQESGLPAELIQTDALGKEIMRTTLPAGSTQAYKLFQLGDGGFMLTADYGSADFLIYRDGKTVTNGVIAIGNDAIPPMPYPARDGFFVFVGESSHKDGHGGTFHVKALEKRGNDGAIQWRHLFEEHEVWINGVLPVDGGYVAYGLMEEQKTGKRYNEGFAAKITNDGEVVWTVSVPEKNGGVNLHAAVECPDGGILLTGENMPHKQPKIGLLIDPFAVRVDVSGAIQWQKTYELGLETSKFDGIVPVDGGSLVLWSEVNYQPPLRMVLLNDSGEITQEFTLDTDEARAAESAALDMHADTPRLLFFNLYEVGGENFAVDKTFHVMNVNITP